MPGRVYIFNATLSDIQIHINDNHVGRLVGMDAKQHYTPSQLSAERCKDGTTNKAQFGSTTKLDLKSERGQVCYMVTLDTREFPIHQDVQVYIFQHSAVIAGSKEQMLSCIIEQD